MLILVHGGPYPEKMRVGSPVPAGIEEEKKDFLTVQERG
jgi:hypothetical protein